MLPLISAENFRSAPVSRRNSRAQASGIYPVVVASGVPSNASANPYAPWGRRVSRSSATGGTFDAPPPASPLHRAQSAGTLGRRPSRQAPPSSPLQLSRSSSCKGRPGSTPSSPGFGVSQKASLWGSAHCGSPTGGAGASSPVSAASSMAAVESCSFRARCIAPGHDRFAASLSLSATHPAAAATPSVTAASASGVTQIVCRREGLEFLLFGEAAEPARRLLDFGALAHAELDRARLLLRLRLRPSEATTELLASFGTTGAPAASSANSFVGNDSGSHSPSSSAAATAIRAPRALHIALCSAEDLVALERHVWPHITRALLAPDAPVAAEPAGTAFGGGGGRCNPGPSLVWTFA